MEDVQMASSRRVGASRRTGRTSRKAGALTEALDGAVASAFRGRKLAPVQPGAGEVSERVETPPPPAAPESPATASAALPVRSSDEPLPARMVNEYVYCARLFYYEHVEGLFLHNADTVRGASIHERVDSGSGAMPKASGKSSEPTRAEVSEEPEVIHSRSVTLGSEKLGVVAKLDLVEVRVEADDLFSATAVCPVDYKAGSPRREEDANVLWDTDKVQLGLQILLLRENGYACDRGTIYYRGTRQRVEMEMTPELDAWVREQVEGARAVEASGILPPPLDHSPKCVRCSLAPICLPDETHALEAGADADEPPRRLIAARDDRRALYLNTPGLRVGVKGRVLQVKEKEKTLEEVRIGDVNHVALFGNIQISTQAIQILCRQETPISYFSMGGWFYGITRGHGLPNIATRIEQFAAASDPARAIVFARGFVTGKIRNQRVLLMRNHLEPPAASIAKMKTLAGKADRAARSDELLGLEGAAANFYFGAFSGMIKTSGDLADDAAGGEAQQVFNFDFEGRNRRPPTDPVNALLSLAYSLLAKDCTIALLAVGLDPWLGFYHTPRAGRPALALDLMEEFRPIVADSAVLNAINNRMIAPTDFLRAGKAVNLTTDGRKRFFQAYEQRMATLITHPVFDYKVSYRRALELQARLLGKTLRREIESYQPLVTR